MLAHCGGIGRGKKEEENVAALDLLSKIRLRKNENFEIKDDDVTTYDSAYKIQCRDSTFVIVVAFQRLCLQIR